MLLVLAALEVRDALVAGAVTKQPFEGELRIVFRRQRLVGRLPGEVVFVGAGVARIAFAGLAYHVAGELERREARQVPDLVGHHLVDGDARLDVRACGLLDAYPGEERAARARVITRTIGPGIRAHAVETRDHLQLIANIHQRRQRRREREVRAAFAGRPPRGGNGAIRHVHIGHARRRLPPGCLCKRRSRGHQCG